MRKEINAKIGVMIPKGLDDIIRENRDKFELRLASDQEKSALYASIPPGPIKNRVENWYFITLFAKSPKQSVVMLLGHIADSSYPWITSEVQRIDLKSHLVFTQSGSCYALEGPEGKGEPGLDLLTAICAAFHEWGSGKYLGIPPWFF